jgi:RNA polymerase sigma-70 factor (ECF subfamily)
VDASDTDERLVRRFQEGSADAFEVLVQRHGTRVYNLCFRILGDPEEAADASQDTFLAALRKLNTFRGDSAFTTWLHRVAVNACYDSLRRKRRRPLLQIVRDEDDDRPEPSLPSPDHADQVARVLEIPVGTVKSRVFRGRAALGRALGTVRGEPSRASQASEEEA